MGQLTQCVIFLLIVLEFYPFMQNIFIFLIMSLLSSTLFATTLNENPPISLFNNKWGIENVSLDKVTQIVRNNFNLQSYRAVKVQVIYNAKHLPDHLLVFLLKKQLHGFTLARVNIDYQYKVLSIENNYQVTKEDNDQQPGKSVNAVACPDIEAQFIAFAPNDDDLEQNITVEVGKAALKHKLKLISLLKNDATRENYLNYMSCPKLVGNFYDGDANPKDIVTVDGYITASEIAELLAKKFRFKVTNIWLACEAFNDPMKSSVIDIAETQKYAAGINDLRIGPSDRAAACAMEGAMKHLPMKETFDACYKKLDIPSDHWGFDGNGSNYFGI